jgi:hypothetical protein
MNSSAPFQLELTVRRRALSQIDVNSALVRNADLFRHPFEILDTPFVEPNGDLLLELACRNDSDDLTSFTALKFGALRDLLARRVPTGFFSTGA